jgi:CDP-glycerol glycerophosphotransferase (TagB/SpsB family)
MTDKHMLEYKSSDHPVYIGAGHGAGDRACGFTGTYKNYDYILISGQAKWNRMKKNKLITNNTGKLIGYPKFDIAFKSDPELFFDNNNPVVLYNPHFNNKETSWFKWGYKILEYFLNNPEFNLIFAPHIMLFKNNNTLKSKYFNAENIHIDINSKNLSNMAYTKSADIYLGDVSSQVYEFVAYKRRPCIFLNTHKKIWQNNDNFRMWNMGIVIDDINGLDFGLSEAQKKFETFKEIQKKLRDRTFSFLSEPAGLRAARAIMDILD